MPDNTAELQRPTGGITGPETVAGVFGPDAKAEVPPAKIGAAEKILEIFKRKFGINATKHIAQRVGEPEANE